MEQLGVMSTVGRRRLRLPILGARLTVEVTVVMATALLVLPFVDSHLSDVPLLSFMVAIGLCAARFGIRGGVGSGLGGAAIASLWYLQGSHYAGGPVDYLLQAVAFLVVGTLVGSAASERRDLERVVSRHSELSVDLICTATFDGFFTRLNPSWERVLGYSPDELKARPFLDFVHPDDRAATLAEVARQTSAGEDVLNFQNRYHCKDGSYRWLEWTSRPDERAGMLFAVARDITARKQAEHALSEHKAALECAVRDRTAELEESRLEMLRRLALAAEYRDDDTFEHTERVGHTAALLAEQLGLSATYVATLRQAAPLHDIGKLGISDTILLKPSKVTDEEFEQIKKHTVDGARILSGSSSDVLELAEQIALTHHERWDGHGYPNRLAGDAIPLCARIVAVADVFDALTHTRPYKHAWPVADAVAEIHRNRGSQFDPTVVDAFERLDPTTLADHQPAHTGAPAKPRPLRRAA
jgi:PAS domain S-box-containing protein/putative nucleotidyltransferase with HDIG domain